jgi:hypothetical protein
MEDGSENWYTHAQTRKFVEGTKEKMNKSFLELEAKCRATSDPQVAAAFMQWKTEAAFLAQFLKRQDKVTKAENGQ